MDCALELVQSGQPQFSWIKETHEIDFALSDVQL